MLFLLYINDIKLSNPHFHLLLFADDTAVVSVDDDLLGVKNNMRTVHSEARDWFTANKLSLNDAKTQQIVFTYRNHDFANPTCVRYLGICLDPHLTWSSHVDSLVGKLASDLFLLRSLKHMVPGSVLLTAYHSLFVSRCSYGIIVWGHSPHANRVFGLQRKVIRLLTNTAFRDDVRDGFVSLGLLTVPCMYMYAALVYVRENIDAYSRHSDIHGHDTRAVGNIRPPFVRLTHGRTAINYYGPLLFNKLPKTVRAMEIVPFKRNVKQLLVARACYSIDEFLEL
jgi:hypothetical protein